jgi:hypothetical protein
MGVSDTGGVDRRQQGGAIDRAAGVFSSIAAHSAGVDGPGLTAIAVDHGLDLDAMWDALAFLECCGMIEVRTVVTATTRGRAAHDDAKGGV